MADNKGRGADYLRIDATAAMTKELDNKFKELFPVMSGETRSKFIIGEIVHTSVEIPKDWKTNPEFRHNIIAILQSAKNPDHPAYSEHGSNRHETFSETIDTLIENVIKGTFTLRLQPIKKQTKQGEVLASRLILEPNVAVERVTYRPFPHQKALDIFNGTKGEKAATKEVRQLTRDNGIAFGLIVMAYYKPSEQDILNFFANEDFRKTLIEKGYKKVPSNKRREDIKMISDICNLLVIEGSKELIASPYPQKYRQVLQILKDNGYISKEQEEEGIYGFQEVSETVLPKVVFVGADEKAQELAPQELVDPMRSTHITSNYGNKLTSIVATAFIEKL